MSTTNPPSTVAPAGALRFLYALMTRLRTLDGPRLETDLALEALDEHRQALAQAAITAREHEGALCRYCRLAAEAMADGVITLRERATLLRAQLALRRTAHHHATHLEHLS